ncbi:hypothetical protein EVAR_60504_1 [Eumeta japonica]|uniref:Uncharacterized protein n=1 Tax=Eumeta variegata TaxID=151549 RepID=A0A4C1ZLW3_EUMVA|nr:hypothetical protein EVAR_60504_1 [Eumeta japonica]
MASGIAACDFIGGLRSKGEMIRDWGQNRHLALDQDEVEHEVVIGTIVDIASMVDIRDVELILYPHWQNRGRKPSTMKLINGNALHPENVHLLCVIAECDISRVNGSSVLPKARGGGEENDDKFKVFNVLLRMSGRRGRCGRALNFQTFSPKKPLVVGRN